MTSKSVRPRLPVANSKYLFGRLLDLYKPELLCDVGSFDGAHSLMFVRPGMKVIALEANPGCAKLMANDPAILDAEVEVRALAAWNKDEEITFNVIEFSTNGASVWKNKLSSILTRTDNTFASHQVAVDAVRLDSMVTASGRSRSTTIALWIDVEGAGYEVLEGISGIVEQVCVVHIEVETTDYWRKQHVWTEVRNLMRDFGHTAVARTRGDRQFDVVFVNNRFIRRNPVATLGLVVLAWSRRIARDAVKLVWWTR